MSLSSKFAPYHVLAVDPAMRVSGYALAHVTAWDKTVTTGVVAGAENLAAADLLAYLGPRERVLLVIEYPTWRGRGTDAVRAAANCWIRHVKAVAPRRNLVHKVTPQTWMASVIPGWRAAERPADLYVPLARRLLGAECPEELDENAAAAVCILHYGESLLRTGRIGVKP